MRFSELPAEMFGLIGERVAALEYKRAGFGVIMSSKYTDDDREAPAIELEARREILPDLDVCKRGRRFWIEVKTYGHAARNHRLSRERECDVHTHGIPVRLFDNHEAVERETGSSVWLAILEVESGLLIMSAVPLSAMRKHACMCGCGGDAGQHRRNGPGIREPQWYFERDDFWSHFRLDEKTHTMLRSKHAELVRPSHALLRHGLDRVPRQTTMFEALGDRRPVGLHVDDAKSGNGR